MPGRKNSEAKIRANNKYNAKAYDRINIAVPKGRKEAIQDAAAAIGESLNKYITTAVDERMERAPGGTDGAADGHNIAKGESDHASI